MTWKIDVDAPREDDAGLRFTVHVDGHTYDVGVSEDAAVELAPGVAAAELVRESFRFLLEHEPPESIMSRFDLPVIERYFPGYANNIKHRLHQ